MSKPCIITVAITGSVPQKKDTPAIITPSVNIMNTLLYFILNYTDMSNLK